MVRKTDKQKQSLITKYTLKQKNLNIKQQKYPTAFNSEFKTLREKFSAQAKELRELKQTLKHCQHVADAAAVLTNSNQQYS